VRSYLEALDQNRPRRGRPRTPASIEKRLKAVEAELADAAPLHRLQLVQERMDLERELDRIDAADDLTGLERDVVKVAEGYGERIVSTRQSTVSHRKVRPAFFWSAPGSKPASVSTWKPLQMPTTGPPAAAKRATASITGENRAIAPVRR